MRVFIIIVIILIVIQFFKPERNLHAGPQPKAITTQYTVPENVDTIMAKACYDCHSNNTRYPWYANVQPVAWWLNDHINGGKYELNFDEFAAYAPAKQYHKLEEVGDMVNHGRMPLSSYTWIHKDAILTDAEKSTIVNWAEGIRKQMESKYPKDSLVTKRPPKQEG